MSPAIGAFSPPDLVKMQANQALGELAVTGSRTRKASPSTRIPSVPQTIPKRRLGISFFRMLPWTGLRFPGCLSLGIASDEVPAWAYIVPAMERASLGRVWDLRVSEVPEKVLELIDSGRSQNWSGNGGKSSGSSVLPGASAPCSEMTGHSTTTPGVSIVTKPAASAARMSSTSSNSASG